ncbi:MAG: hypothetical protein JXQ23_10585, partial [Clostridia bacterium]|nr:hypothetical protein [Clostridia bacterium]
IKYDMENEIRIVVYNHSGKGGIGEEIPAAIGDYFELQTVVFHFNSINDWPRIIMIFIMIVTSLYVSLIMTGIIKRTGFPSLIQRIHFALNPFLVINTILKKGEIQENLYSEIIFKYSLYVIALICFSIFMSYELSFSHSYALSSSFICRYLHVPILYCGLCSLIIALHYDLFFHSFDNPTGLKQYIRIVFGILTLPIFFIAYVVHTLFLPSSIITNDFVSRGAIIIICIFSVLIVRIIHQIVISQLNRSNRSDNIGGIVISMLSSIGCILTLILYLNSQTMFFYQASVIGSFFVFIFITGSVRHEQKRTAIYLEYEKRKLSRKDRTSDDKLGIIIDFINENYTENLTRSDISSGLGISQ